MTAPTTVPYTLILLCGGRGSRLGGVDKGLLPAADGTLAEQLLQRLSPAQAIISANRNLGSYRQLGHAVVTDLRPGFQGPLAGIESALQWLCDAQRCASVQDSPVVIVATDMPQLPADLALRLLAQLTPDRIVIAHDGARTQPLCMALYPQHWLASLTQWLDQGGRSVTGWLADKPLMQVVFKDPSAFCNINQATDLWQLAG